MILLFFAKQDWRSINILEEIMLPKRNHVWFVEHIKTQKWIKIKKGNEFRLTSNPSLAKKFETEVRALSFCIENKLGEDFKPTEHEI